MRYPSLTRPARPLDPPYPHRLTRRDAPGGPGGRQPPLVAVAHGSADPRAAASTQELMGLVRGLAGGSTRPAPDIRTAFLGHAPPSVGQVIGALAGAAAPAHAAPGTVVVLPLLLTAAYHSEVDLPALLAEASAAAWPAAETSVVLAAAGSARPESNEVIAALARQWQAARGWRAVVPAFAAAAPPSPVEAVASLRRAGARRVVVATYLLAPGFFADRIAASSLAAGAVAVSAALGAAPEVADLVLRRYAGALGRPAMAVTAGRAVLAARCGPLEGAAFPPRSLGAPSSRLIARQENSAAARHERVLLAPPAGARA